ncbi:winged helix-turn-helix transcriptional regulator [Nocardiopsis aegyptia]|uniref:DNA-binding HxlR family transcriptional regulator n=1 Tax=Nocardiopsis aegyptia TaxID=220378 RepID=A0A7Z0ENY8_9ACTN|nr:helix-turn-helix domain-containing protein [Nocardiopsis aegyptia]NYJ34768.1 DNA-binding HxlR family transcriptional regulator [Nocardiopsis aegyptia]
MTDTEPGRDWTDPTCPVARTIDLVGDRWSLLIVRDAMDGPASFTEFHRRLGIARNILSDRLRRLVDHGILSTTPSGRRHVYKLTGAGRDLFTAIVALRQWGERHAFADGEPRSRLVDTEGRPVAELRPHGQDGTPLTTDATHVERVV